jgi:hypothetical protein
VPQVSNFTDPPAPGSLEDWVDATRLAVTQRDLYREQLAQIDDLCRNAYVWVEGVAVVPVADIHAIRGA